MIGNLQACGGQRGLAIMFHLLWLEQGSSLVRSRAYGNWQFRHVSRKRWANIARTLLAL
jgi:hypothetical protein